ncbi:hypothetical protein N7517_002101 [Penicillium concentricum]|uniref:Uncharacterized protein n=1 Tax=Penicillium concentricum TaxID=293559 RepID=A0A9W9VLA6_9EURO|nr:uncharacterized protein N7517_002101 [Penicillium concentricum]KAJ5384190.1 hypothetical protein N7517_002101 [Penicillium concentricum]
MARGMTGVQSHTQYEETISFPVLTYTDALPRNDLQSLEASQRPIQPMIEKWDFSQPSTGDGWFRKPPPGQGATFDFRLTAPPDEAIQSTRSGRTQTEQHMIGIALGSPGMLNKDEALPPPRFDTSIFAERDSANKPSKWKKIGGFFKAKNAFTSPPEAPQESTFKPQINNDKLPEKPHKARLRKNSTEEWPKLEVDPRQMPMPGRSDQRPLRSRNFSLSNKAPKEEPSTRGLLLSVDIPDIQMERYSVMFSNVVNKNQKPSLLARRAKTLDNLRVPDANGFLKSPAPPPMPQRRATSPARSSFTLFPSSQPSKGAQVLGTQNFSRGPSPLIRANTLPIESPSKMPPPKLHHGSNMGSISSFESPVIPKLFSERSNTPRSSSSYDKPLPAIKPEPQTTQLQKSAQPERKSPSPQKTRPQQSVQSHNTVATKPVQPWVNPRQRKDSLPRAIEKQPQATSPQSKTQHQPNTTSNHHRTNDSVRPRLRVQTEGRPPPPAKDTLSSSTSRSPPSALNPTQTKIDRIMSPLSASTGPKSGVSPSESTRMPFTDPVETIGTVEKEPAPEPRRPIPKIEVSIARSVSVSRAKRQVLVPIGMRINDLDPEERVVHRRPLTPQITDAHRGHRPGVSQELRIECL